MPNRPPGGLFLHLPAGRAIIPGKTSSRGEILPFDRDLAAQTAKSRDRDSAPFFAGRKAEIRAFDDAVDEAGRYEQAAFRIYEGAPGSGKTSLAAHLAKTRADKLVFVKLDAEDLSDAKALAERIRIASIERGRVAAKAGAAIVKIASTHLRHEHLSDMTRDGIAKMSARGARLVLHLDEAHAIVPESANMLRKLHTTGIGAPCVMMMTGLGHTSLRVADVPGLSRLASNAVVKMGTMEASECAESTATMLGAMNVFGDPAEVEAIARETAELAHKWPQHLFCAQSALCEELIRTDGVLRDVDVEHLRARSDELRHRYYDRRLTAPAFRIDPALMHRILVEVAKDRHPPLSARWQLRQLCEDVIDRAGLSDAPEFQELPRGAISTALIEKGIVSDAGGKWAVAIPSMADWSAAEIGDDPPPSAQPAARSQSRGF